MTDRPTIVLIDDSADVRLLVKTRLKASGRFDVVGEGANGVEAIGLAFQLRPSVLLLDLSMPGMDGLEALPGVLEVSPDTRIIMYTGFEEQGLAEAARSMGATGFIEKSLPIDRLPDEILGVLSDGEAVDEGGARRPQLAVVGTRAPPLDDEAQRVLDEHMESFRGVFEEAAIGMATMTLSGSVVRANRALAALMRCDVSELVGVDYGRLTSGRGDVLDAALHRISMGEIDVVQLDHDIAGWSEPRRGRCSLAAVRDSHGNALYVFLQLQDITAQALAEQQLAVTEERFRLLIEAVEEYAIFMLDQHGYVVSWNAGAQRIKGYLSEEILGQHFRVFYPPAEQRRAHPEHELELALRDGRYAEEGWRIRKDGTRFWANVLITPVRDEAGQHVGFAKVTRDATERRQVEDERAANAVVLTRANAELEELAGQLRQAVDDQSQFLAITTHELRSPVAVLTGSAATLSRHEANLSDAERGTLLGAMRSSSARLERLLKDLLAASRAETPTMATELTVVPVHVILEQAADGARAAGTSDAIAVDVDSSLHVFVDQDRLVQAVDNLVRNAINHGAPPLLLSAAEDDEVVTIRVSDSGPGVDPAFRQRLFAPFTSDGADDSTGLGLFITRAILRAHGGEASYQDPSDDYPAGVFELSLPAPSPETSIRPGATG
jgi:PAS domain S-box-containing protein